MLRRRRGKAKIFQPLDFERKTWILVSRKIELDSFIENDNFPSVHKELDSCISGDVCFESKNTNFNLDFDSAQCQIQIQFGWFQQDK